MMNRFYPMALAVVLGAAAFAVPGASGMTLPATQSTVADGVINGDNPLLQEVAKRNWDRRRDGNRYRNRHGSYRHFHNGYYYSTPWWALTIPLVGAIIFHDRDYCRRRGYSRHHSWTYHGRRHRCRY